MVYTADRANRFACGFKHSGATIIIVAPACANRPVDPAGIS
jgi:hypothetical protein